MRAWNKRQMEGLEEQLRQELSQLGSEIKLPDDRKMQLRREIRGEIQKRRKMMSKMSGKKMVLAAAAMMVLAAGTAIGAGKIAYLSSGTNVNEIDFANAQSVMNSKILGGKAKAVQTFADGCDFEKGYFIEVKANDSAGNQVGKYPEITIHYENDVVLSISKPLDGVGKSGYPVVLADSYDEIEIEVSEMEYLFLPPDAQVSAEDQALMEAGKQEISYGSEKEERKLYRGATWEEDGLSYHLLTMNGGETPKELMEKAKEIIAVE